MKLMITLEAARRNAGYTLKEAAPLFHIHEQTLAAYENDSSDVPFSFIRMIPNVYHFPTNNIFFGKKYEFIRTIRMEKEEVS
ncbi:helix-turn-helix transcriptional regulator [Sporolactobacillus shoreicorticis]|uniref:Helix-turn-helix domain-containing protein n=1 Tax=Sporolactobacillus shoreicorticis TaxID=1923877 RepID=A0ABW5S8M0_9BACL|nr:helix-turn-helix transcriptional regulator [Sporolactobacillus shoreicorticis]MCO7126183.1 helix-turn-helix transcriptional regulator [Sporolactobacillus shoreicorticis]